MAILATAAALWLLRGGEEAAILARLETLRDLAGKHAPESGIEQLARANRIAELFSEASRIDLSGLGHGTTRVANRQELVRHVVALRVRLASLEIELQSPQVRIEGDTATVTVTGSGLGSMTGSAGQFLEIHTAVVTLEKRNGDWLVTGGRHLRDERQGEAVP